MFGRMAIFNLARLILPAKKIYYFMFYISVKNWPANFIHMSKDSPVHYLFLEIKKIKNIINRSTTSKFV